MYILCVLLLGLKLMKSLFTMMMMMMMVLLSSCEWIDREAGSTGGEIYKWIR